MDWPKIFVWSAAFAFCLAVWYGIFLLADWII
jgi:hypothetical protein